MAEQSKTAGIYIDGAQAVKTAIDALADAVVRVIRACEESHLSDENTKIALKTLSQGPIMSGGHTAITNSVFNVKPDSPNVVTGPDCPPATVPPGWTPPEKVEPGLLIPPTYGAPGDQADPPVHHSI